MLNSLVFAVNKLLKLPAFKLQSSLNLHYLEAFLRQHNTSSVLWGVSYNREYTPVPSCYIVFLSIRVHKSYLFERTLQPYLNNSVVSKTEQFWGLAGKKKIFKVATKLPGDLSVIKVKNICKETKSDFFKCTKLVFHNSKRIRISQHDPATQMSRTCMDYWNTFKKL